MALCVVIGPIGKEGSSERKHSDLLLNAVIKYALQQDEFGYVVKRAVEDADSGMIGDRVVTDIINAELVVADLTDLNPKAFYELGIRHSTEKATIHVATVGTVLPFNTITHRAIFVDLSDWHSIEQARERLSNSVRAIKDPKYKVCNPITQANASFKMRQSEDPRDRVMAEMQERLAALENTLASARSPTQFVGFYEGIPDRPDLRKFDEKMEEMAAALKVGKTIEAIKAYRKIVGTKLLMEVKKLVDAIMSGQKNEAIEMHRQIANTGLKEAKEFIEAVIARTKNC